MIISLEERIYALSLIWREAKYNFAYWDERPELDWDAAYRQALPRVMAANDAYAFFRELQRFVALLRDGHSYVVMPTDLKIPTSWAPFETSYIEGKHVLMEVPKDSGIPLYTEIVAVNGTPLEEYLQKYVYPYGWHEKTDSVFCYGKLGFEIATQEKGRVTIDTTMGCFSYDSDVRVETMEGNWFYALTVKDQDTARVIVMEDNLLDISITSDNIAIITPFTFCDERLKEVLYAYIAQCEDCVGFIIDIRYNNGGNSSNVHPLVQLFFEGAFPDPPCDVVQYIPHYGAYGQNYNDVEQLDLQDPHAKKIYDINKRKMFYREVDTTHVPDCPLYLSQPVVVVFDSETASAAEDFVCHMKHKNRATLVGSPSYGSNGQPYNGDLPGGGRYGICTMKCYMLDGTVYNNIGIQPDVYVENTIQNHIDKFDAVLDKGLSILREKIDERI